MNAYDTWLEAPYQASAAYGEAFDAATDWERDSLIRDLHKKPATRIELFDAAFGFRTPEQADRMVQAWGKQDFAAMGAIYADLLEAQFERTVELRAEKDAA